MVSPGGNPLCRSQT